MRTLPSGHLSPGYWHQASVQCQLLPRLGQAGVSTTITRWPIGIGSKVAAAQRRVSDSNIGYPSVSRTVVGLCNDPGGSKFLGLTSVSSVAPLPT